MPQVEWRTVKKSFKPKGYKEITSGNAAENAERLLMSFLDLMGAEKSNNPKSLLELEARTVLNDRSRREQELEANTQRENPLIIEVDLTAESPSESPEVSIIKKEKNRSQLQKKQLASKGNEYRKQPRQSYQVVR